MIMFGNKTKEETSNTATIESKPAFQTDVTQTSVKKGSGRLTGASKRKTLGTHSFIKDMKDKRRYRKCTMSDLYEIRAICDEMINKKKHAHIVNLEKERAALDKELDTLRGGA